MTDQLIDDIRWMDEALSLACERKDLTAPNPPVGAVLVKNGTAIGRGYHKGPGTAHAEAAAIDDAHAKGKDPSGASLYVTLEPCCHEGEGKKTPPCVPRIIKEGITRVRAGCIDPNPRVSGKGIGALKKAGIDAGFGPRAFEAHELIAPFSVWVRYSRPFVKLKWAQTIDGKIAASNGSSRWISCSESRLKAHSMREESDSVAVGARTVRADDPALTARGERGSLLPHQPAKIVFAGKAALPETARVFLEHAETTWIVGAEKGHASEFAERKCGSRFIPWDGEDFGTLGKQLLENGFYSILVEGGSTLISSFLRAGMWDSLAVFIAPLILGDGIGIPSPLGRETMTDALKPCAGTWTQVGTDTLYKAWNPEFHAWACANGDE